MPNFCAAACALLRSREAMAATSLHSLRCIAGITFRVAIDAVPSTPQRTFSLMSQRRQSQPVLSSVCRNALARCTRFLEFLQTFGQVVDEIFGALASGRKPDQAVGESQFCSRLGWNRRVCHGRRMANQRFHSAQALAQREVFA